QAATRAHEHGIDKVGRLDAGLADHAADGLGAPQAPRPDDGESHWRHPAEKSFTPGRLPARQLHQPAFTAPRQRSPSSEARPRIRQPQNCLKAVTTSPAVTATVRGPRRSTAGNRVHARAQAVRLKSTSKVTGPSMR